MVDSSFSNPGRLWALALVPVVFLLLRLLRRRAALLDVPSLALWRVALAHLKSLDRVWLQRVLMVLRAALLAGLVVLWAGPVQLATQPQRGTTIVVLDLSLGTAAAAAGGGTLAEAVVRQGRELVALCAADGPIGVGWIGDGFHAAGALGDDAATDALLRDPPRPQGSRNLLPLQELAEQAEAPTRVLLVSPFEPSVAERNSLEAAGVVLHAVGGVQAQAGIVAVARGTGETLRVTVRGGGPPRQLELRSAESVLVSQAVTPDAVGATVSVQLPPAASEQLELRLQPADAFPADDVAHVALPERRRLSVMLVSDAETPELDAYFAASECVDRARSVRMSNAEFANTLQQADVTVLSGVAVQGPLPVGRYLMVNATAPDVSLRLRSERTRATLLDVAKNEPMLRGLDFSDADWPLLPMTECAAGAEVLLRTSAGPLLLRERLSIGPVLCLAAPLERSATNLAALPLLPLLLDGALRSLALPRQFLVPPAERVGAALTLLPGEATTVHSVPDAELQTLQILPADEGHAAPDPGWWRSSTGRLLATAVLDSAGLPGAPLRSSGALVPFLAETSATSLRAELALLLGLLLLLEWTLPLLLRLRRTA